MSRGADHPRPKGSRTMAHCMHRAAALCSVLLFALLVNAARIQIVQSGEYDANPANRRAVIARYGQPRGDILVGGRPVTGNKDTGEQLRYERTYRDGPLYAPVTGYASQLYGTSLLEHAADPVLSGTDPLLAPLLPAWQDFLRARTPGGHAVTTIDARAQKAAYDGLAGKKGAVAAVEPATGRVLALVSAPSYDPARLSGTNAAVTRAWARLGADPDRPMLNRAIGQTYPPGSTFKVVTAAAALDAKVVRDLDARTDSPDPYRLPGTDVRLTNEVEGCADASLRHAFAWSCNTFFAKLGVRVGLPAMAATARAFGFNDGESRIPLPVARSDFDTRMNDSQLALSSIGQFNTRATPLQMAMVSAAVAAGGTVPAPHLLERTTDGAGGTVSRNRPRGSRTAMQASTALRLRELMVDAVREGTGGNAAIRGATVGGKTGTAQHGLGNSGTPYAWFIAWARADGAPEPAVAVAVVIEDSGARRSEISGGGTAAPIARAVMRAVLRK